MTDPAAEKLKYAISDDAKCWLGQVIRELAFRHDVEGPAISYVSEFRYKQDVIVIFRNQILAGQLAGEVQFAPDDLNTICELAANELFRIRSILNAHAKGTLTTEQMRELPVYAGYPDYFEPTLETQLQGFIALRQQSGTGNDPVDSPTPMQASVPAPGKSATQDGAVSVKTQEWMEVYMLGIILEIEIFGLADSGAVTNELIKKQAAEFRPHVERAIRIGNLDLTTECIDSICETAVREAFSAVQLKRSFSKGRISRRKLRRHGLYGKYKEYFDDAPAMLQTIAGAVVVIEKLAQERAAKGN